MGKPTAYRGKRAIPLITGAAQLAAEAEQTASNAAPIGHVHPQSEVEGLTAALAAKAADAAVVHKAGIESITGAKTFDLDITVSNKTKGLILVDRVTDAPFRLYVSGGVLSIEAV